MIDRLRPARRGRATRGRCAVRAPALRRRRFPSAAAALAALALIVTAAGPGPAAAKPSAAALARDRVAAAATVYAKVEAAWKAGTATVEQVHRWSVRWLTAQRDQPLTGKAWKQALADHLARMVLVERAAAAAVAAGTATALDRDQAAYFRLEAELWQARGKLP